MAIIKPFCAIRPDREKADKIAALPYDVYSREEAKAEVEKNPESFLKIDRAETQFADTVDTYDPKVYQKAHDILWKMVEDGAFVREEKKCYYIYTLTMNGRTQTGITACASIDDYEKGVIKKHENTRAEKEQDRINHVNCCNAQTGPIFLAYRSNPVINQIVSQTQKGETLYDFTAEDGVRHSVWVISEENQIAAVEQAFAGIGEIYIADGHHRAASAVRVGQMRRKEHPGYTGEEEFNYFLSVLFPDEQLMIMDYNRVLKDLNGLSEEEFLAKVSEIFTVTPISQEMPSGLTQPGGWQNEELQNFPPDVSQEQPFCKKFCNKMEMEKMKPKKKGEFSMYLKGNWYLCTVRPEDWSSDPVEGLDVSVLQNKLLSPVLGIEDPRTDSRIDFVGGIRGLKELERRCSLDCAAAFAMYPTSIQELFAVADAGRLMPPKSTWFEPKLRSGLFIHELE